MTRSQSRQHSKNAGRYKIAFETTEKNKRRRAATRERRMRVRASLPSHDTRHTARKTRRAGIKKA